MDSSPSKRRKVSPAAGVAVDASNTANRPASRDARPMTPARSSFMSPTKASLARYYPGLLARPSSAGEGAHRVGIPTTHLGSPDRALSPRKLNAVSLRPTTPTRRLDRLSASPIRVGSASPRKTPTQFGGGLSLPARRRSNTPGRASEPGLSSPRRQATPDELDIQQAIQDPVTSQLVQELEATAAPQSALAPTSPRAGRAPRGDDGEPDLPPTPEQLGLKPMPEPPRGLLTSSPTARVSRTKVATKSSPLKPRGDPLDRSDQDRSAAVEEQGLEKIQEAVNYPVATVQEDEDISKLKATHQALLAQLEATQLDIITLETGVVALQGLPASEPDNVEELVSTITSTNPTNNSTRPQPKPLSLSSRLARFLPFSRHLSRPKEPVEEAPRQLASYDPIVLDDPIPQLQAFTPLTITTTETVIETSLHGDTLLTQQDFSLLGPFSLISIDLRLIVAAMTDSVDSLYLRNITPWAGQELGSWITAQALTGEVSTVGWACGRYWNLALLRAKTWARCHEKYRHLTLNIGTRARQPLSIKNVPRPRDGAQDNPLSTTGRSSSDASLDEPSRAAIHVHLGTQSLQFFRDGVSLVVLWKIVFDWTGEAESQISASAAFPQAWRDVDERASLAKLGEVFGQLVKERGVTEAVGVVVGLIFPEE